MGACETREDHDDLPNRMRRQADEIKTTARRQAKQIRQAADSIEKVRGQR